MKNKELIEQERLVLKEIARFLNLSAEHFPDERGSVVNEETCAFLIVSVQAPSDERETLLSAHVLSPATSEALEYNSMTISQIQTYGISSVLASLMADEFQKIAPKVLAIAEQLEGVHLEGGHA